MQYSKQARDASRAVLENIKDEGGWFTHRISLAIVVLITAGAAIAAGITNRELSQSQQCTEDTFSSIIRVLNERTSLSSDLNKADKAQNEAFAELLKAALTEPPLGKNETRGLALNYNLKLGQYLSLLDAQENLRYPTNRDYTNCLEGKKK